MLQQVCLQEFIVETIGLFRVDAVLEHEEVVTVAVAGLLVPVVRRVHRHRHRYKLIGIHTPDLAGTGRTGQQFLDRELTILQCDFCHGDILTTMQRLIIVEGVDVAIELDLSTETCFTTTTSKTVHIEAVLAFLHLLNVRPGNILDSNLIPRRMSDINVQAAISTRVPLVAEIDVILIWFNAMSIFIVFIPFTRHIVPLNRETQHAIHLTASSLNVFADIAVCHIAGIRPAETIGPLEHAWRTLILRRNQRYHVLREAILHEQFQTCRSRQNFFDKLFDADFFCAAELLGISTQRFRHCLKRIRSAHHTRGGITVAEHDVVGSNIVQSSKPATQAVHVAQLSDSFLCVFQHLLGENRLGALIVGRSNHLLKSSHSSIHIHTLAQVHQQSTDCRIADTKPVHRHTAGSHPNISGLLFIRQTIIHSLIDFETTNQRFKLLTAIQTILSNQLKHSVHGIHGQLLQRTLEHISRITPLSHLGRHVIGTHNEPLRNLDSEMIPGMNRLMISVILIVHLSAKLAIRDHIAADVIRVHNSAGFHIGRQRIHNRLINIGLGIEIPDGDHLTIHERNQLTDVLHEATAAGAIILTALTEDGIRASREAVQIEVIQLILIGIGDKQRCAILHHLIEMLLKQSAEFFEVCHCFHSPFLITVNCHKCIRSGFQTSTQSIAMGFPLAYRNHRHRNIH